MKYYPTLLALTLATALPALLAAQEPAAIASALIAKNQDALVEIKATVTIKPEVIEGPPGVGDMVAGQPEKAQDSQAKGVVIHSSGLIVAPLALLDPAAIFGDGIELDTPMGRLKLGMKSSVSSITVVLADGREFPADLILRENAAGLALLKVATPPEEGLKAVTLVNDLPVPQPFSQLYDVVRLDADFGRAPAVRMLRMVQSVPPPVSLYEFSGPMRTPGSAAFDPSGRFLGMSVIPLRNKGGGNSLAAAAETGVWILPVSEILRLCGKALP